MLSIIFVINCPISLYSFQPHPHKLHYEMLSETFENHRKCQIRLMFLLCVVAAVIILPKIMLISGIE